MECLQHRQASQEVVQGARLQFKYVESVLAEHQLVDGVYWVCPGKE